MRVISDSEYMENVEDTICMVLEDAVKAAWLTVADEYGIPNAIENVDNVRYSFVDGILPSVKDSVIETFEYWGLDVRPGGKER